MAEPERGPREIDTGERVGALESAVGRRRETHGGRRARDPARRGAARRAWPGQGTHRWLWPEAPNKVARQMLDQ